MYGEKHASTSESVEQFLSERDKCRPIKIVTNFTEDNQIERAVWYLVGQSTLLDNDVRQSTAAILCPRGCSGRDVRGLDISAHECQLLRQDTDGTARLEGALIAPSAESIQNPGIPIMLVGTGGKSPRVRDISIHLFEKCLRARIARHE